MTRPPEPWRIVLVVEDDSDGRAVAELVSRSGQDVTVDWLPANGIGNIKRNAARLISLARDRLEGRRGCVAVVVDRDGRNPGREEPHRTISRTCRRSRVEFIAAREALEAWFLADPGICRWLGVPLPGNTEGIRNPKRRVEQAFFRRTGRAYRRRRARLEVARQATGVDAARNGSARVAFEAVRRCLGAENPSRPHARGVLR